jgi:hypothetical protein
MRFQLHSRAIGEGQGTVRAAGERKNAIDERNRGFWSLSRTGIEQRKPERDIRQLFVLVHAAQFGMSPNKMAQVAEVTMVQLL